jgi:S-DNA-T family DNA segregation ATPase FtsK/SpoIIIE
VSGDELYDEAARIVVETGKASISLLQRSLRIGFSRACYLLDQMEARGLVTPASPLGRRELVRGKGSDA